MQETSPKSPKWNPNTKWKCVFKVSLKICHGIKLLVANLPFLSWSNVASRWARLQGLEMQETFNRFPSLCSKCVFIQVARTEEGTKVTHVQLYGDICTTMNWAKQQVKLKNIAKKQQQPKPLWRKFWMESTCASFHHYFPLVSRVCIWMLALER